MKYHLYLKRFFTAVAALGAFAVAGCEKAASTSSSANGGGAEQPSGTFATTGLRLTTELIIGDTEIRGVQTSVTRVACAGENEFAAHSDALTSGVLDMPFPGVEAGIEGVGFEGHAFSDAFFVLPAGCYDVVSHVVDGDGTPVDDCYEATAAGLEVKDGETTDAWLVAQCKGPPVGALDVTTIINRPPVIEGFTFNPSKYTQCEPVTLCARASDPDGDAVEFEWEQTAGPTLDTDFSVLTSEEKDGIFEECVRVTPTASGEHGVKVTVYDMIEIDGVETRVEAYLAEQGEPHPSRDDLRVPLYVACTDGGDDGDDGTDETDSNEPPVDGADGEDGTDETDSNEPPVDGMDGDDGDDGDEHPCICPKTQGYWKNHPDDWPVDSLSLGSPIGVHVYAKAELVALLGMDGAGDASITLAKQIIAAKLNALISVDVEPILADFETGDFLIGDNALPAGIAPNSAAGQMMIALAALLDEWNNGLLTDGCE